MKRRNLAALLAAAVASLAAPAASAQAFPSKPVTLVVPFAPGGLADLVGRVLAVQLEQSLHQPVTVVNRAGASGAIGTAFVAKAPADGYTLLMTLTSHVVLPESDRLLGRPPAYELAQFRPVGRVTLEPVVLLGDAKSADDTVQKIVAAAKAAPGTVAYSSTGYYANGHVSIEGFAQAAGIKLLHVPYQGGSQAIAAVAGGQVALATGGPATAASFAKSGRLRALAVLGDERLPALPDVPTLRQLGYDSTYYVWTGVFAPAGTPSAVMDVLRAAVKTAAANPQFKSSLDKMDTTIAYLDAPAFTSFVADESKRLAQVAKTIGAIDAAR